MIGKLNLITIHKIFSEKYVGNVAVLVEVVVDNLVVLICVTILL